MDANTLGNPPTQAATTPTAGGTAPANNPAPAAATPTAGGTAPANNPAPAAATPTAAVTESTSGDGKPVSAVGKLLGDGASKGEASADVVGASPSFTDDDYKTAYGELNDDEARTNGESFMKHFKDAGISPKQAAKLAKAYADTQREAVASLKSELKEQSEKAMAGWTEEDKFAVKDAVRTYIPENSPLYNVITMTEVGHDPHLLEMLKTLGKGFKRDTLVGAGGKGATSASVPLTKQLGIEL